MAYKTLSKARKAWEVHVEVLYVANRRDDTKVITKRLCSNECRYNLLRYFTIDGLYYVSVDGSNVAPEVAFEWLDSRNDL